MEKYFRNYIGILICTHIIVGLFTYWLGLQASDSNYIYYKQIGEQDIKDLFSVMPNLPFPDVHSPVYLIQLAKYEAFVSHALQELRNQSSLLQVELVQKIEEYLFVYQEEMSRADLDEASSEEQALVVAQNPLLSLNMIWRFTYDLTNIFEQLQEQPYISRVQNGPGKEFITNLNYFAKWPNTFTLKEAMVGLLRIQMVHDMDAAELAVGGLFAVDTGPRMSIPLIYELGKYARSKKMYTMAVPWLELAFKEMQLFEQEGGSRTMNFEFSASQVEIQLLETMMEHDMDLPNRFVWQHYFYNDLLMDENYVPIKGRLPIRKTNFTHLQKSDSELYHNDINYWSLCSGSNHQTEQEKSELFCWYDTTTNPALTIYPVKKELLSRTPYVVQMYDLLTEPTVKKLVDWASPKLTRSRVVEEKTAIPGGSGNQLTPYSSTRTSVEAFVLNHDKQFAEVSNELSKLVEITTGLSVVPRSSSEHFLVASYSYGGHYDCHLDAFEDEQTGGYRGNRIATMMFYLDDTSAGGLTAFPQAGTAATPSKGGAIFWYNLKRNGDLDETTHHCACPVVLGHKSISTKWIRYNDQFKSHPCGLHKDDQYAPIPNF